MFKSRQQTVSVWQIIGLKTKSLPESKVLKSLTWMYPMTENYTSIFYYSKVAARKINPASPVAADCGRMTVTRQMMLSVFVLAFLKIAKG
jgi:hypothetical protein